MALYPALIFAYYAIMLYMHYVYILQNKLDKLYYGCTNDLRRRFQEHNSGKVFSTRDSQWKLIYYEAYLSKQDAYNRERQLKYYGQSLSHLKRRIKNSLNLGKN
jgi:putative endonuclease